MDEALQGLNNVHHIVDDCLIASETWEQHVDDVNNFLQRCREKSISLNPNKFVFGQTCVTFAGLRLSKDGFSMDPKLFDAIRNFLHRATRQMSDLSSD